MAGEIAQLIIPQMISVIKKIGNIPVVKGIAMIAILNRIIDDTTVRFVPSISARVPPIPPPLTAAIPKIRKRMLIHAALKSIVS